MTPSDLTEYLNVLKTASVGSAHLILGDGVHINVVFNIDVPNDTGSNSPVEPGGWKAPPNLDSNKLFETGEHDV